MKELDARLYRLSREIKRIEEFGEDLPEELKRREGHLIRRFNKLQRRYFNQNGFTWNPLMYSGNTLRENDEYA